MRGSDEQTSGMFGYVAPEHRPSGSSPARDPPETDEVLTTLSPRFDRCTRRWAGCRSRPSKLLRALLLQSLYTIRSERPLMEEIDYSILFR
jgi:hypothetical protein